MLLFKTVFSLLILSFQLVTSCPITSQDEGIVYVVGYTVRPSQQQLKKPDYSDLSSCTTITDHCCICNNIDVLVCSELESALLQYYSINTTYKAIFLGENNHTTNYSITKVWPLSNNSLWMLGLGDTTINCKGKGALEYYNINEITMRNIVWDSCIYTTEQTPKGGLVMIDCYNVLLDNITVINSPHTGLQINIFDIPKDYTYTITNSYFINNGNQSTNVIGGAIDLYIPLIFGQTDHIEFTIQNVTFIDNQAGYGGGVAITMKNLPYTSCQSKLPQVSFINSTFTNNSAVKNGGGVYLYTQSALFQSSFVNCNFTGNSVGDSGGGTYIKLESDTPCKLHLIQFNDCHWKHNSGLKSLALKLESTQTDIINATIYRNTFQNSVSPAGQFLGGESTCTLECIGIDIILEHTSFIGNNGSGLCIERAIATFLNNALFYYNTAYKGGGINLQESSLLSLRPNSFLNFTDNTAVYGAGIYQETVVQKQQSNECFLQKNNTNRNSTQTTKPTLHFQNNRAYISGRALFFGDPVQECISEKDYINIQYSLQQIDNSLTNEITSLATNFTLHNPTNNNNNSITMILGQYLVLNTTLQDLFGNYTIALVNVFLLPIDESLFQPISHQLNGFKSFTIESGINTPNLYIKGPQIPRGQNVIYSLKITQADRVYSPNQISLKLILKSCSAGFKEGQEKCECASDALQCNFTSATACIRRGYWHGRVTGNIDDNNTHVGHVTEPCTSGKCANIENCQHCPSDGLNDYCHLSENLQDQCVENQAGVLCTACKEGYAYSFGAINCVPVSTCEKGKWLGLVIATLLFILTLLGLVVILLKLGQSLKVGYMFSVLYYFSIIRYLLALNNVAQPLLITVSIFQSITQLNPHFLGYVPLCLSKDSTILEHQMLFYTSPLLITIIVLSVIWLSKCCPRYLTFNDNTPVRSISLLILLSFTALAETSFNILNPIEFEENEQVYVNIQPSTRYWDLTEHLPWFLIALFVEIFLVIPFTFLLLFAPLLVRCCNLNKIKPFLDEFQDCYKDRHRWMAGYYFACRLIYLAVAISPQSNNESLQYIYQAVTLCVLIIHITILPYKSDWLNAIDSLILSNLLFLAISYGVTADVIYGNAPFSGNQGYDLQLSITFLLVLFPVFYSIFGLVYVFSSKVLAKYKDRLRDKLPQRIRGQSTNYSLVHERRQTMAQPLLTASFSEEYREPSLEIFDESERGGRRRTKRETVRSTVIERPRNLSVSYRSAQEWQEKVTTTITRGQHEGSYENEEGEQL